MPNQNNRPMSKNKAREEFVTVFDFKKCLKELVEVNERLIDLATNMEKEPSTARVGANKAIAEINLKLLGKVVPDLKAVELSGEEGGPIKTEGKIVFVPASLDEKD